MTMSIKSNTCIECVIFISANEILIKSIPSINHKANPYKTA